MTLSKHKLRLLIVEDSPEDASILLRELEARGFAPDWRQVATEADLRDALAKAEWDLVIADYTMPGFSGTAALQQVRQAGLDLPFIFVSGTLGEETAVAAMKAGANDYITKGNLARLAPAIERELREARNRAGMRRLEGRTGAETSMLEAKIRDLENQVASVTRQMRTESHPAAPGPAAKARILLVDDHPENLLALDAILSDLGQDLVKAGSGEEALKIAYDGNFALILLDVRMPGLNGFQTAELLRKTERTRRIPIIFLTANGDRPDDVQRGYLAGAVDYITKPVIPDILRAKVGVFLDLHRKEAELRAKTARLEELNKELEDFTYSVSHDLRAPLRAVRGFSQILLEESGALDASARDLAERIRDGAVRMQMLIEGLLALCHLTRSEIKLGTLDLGWAVEEALKIVAEEVTARGARVEVIKPLPRARGHGLSLIQAVVNLISNALKFTLPGVPPEVTVRAETVRDRVRLWVEDKGIGISPQHHARIFGVFERLHAQSAYPGSGVGLAIVRKAMERMGGGCGVASTPGQGSRFWVELPAIYLDDPTPGLLSPPARGRP